MERLSVLEKERIEAQSEALLRDNNIDATNGFDIVLLAKKMGFVVGNAKLAENEDGFIAVDKEKTLFGTGLNKMIGVNATRDYFDKRFIIAHELGHYVLDGGCEQTIYAHREHKVDRRSDDEQDKDYFAASLLMPRKEFSAKYEEIGRETDIIAKQVDMLYKIFEAPWDSAMRRLQELGFIARSR